MGTYWRRLLLGAMSLAMAGVAPAGGSAPAADQQQAEIARLKREQQRLLHDVKREIALLPPEPPVDAALTPKERELLARRRELIALLAEVEQRIKSDQAGRTKYISMGETEEPYKTYIRNFQRRVEEAGAKDLPRVNGKPLYGDVLLGISISASGRIRNIDVHRSSSDALTKHAINLLKGLEPFDEFGAQMGPDVDLIVLAAPFSYQKK